MCGIIAAFNYGENKENVNDFINNQLQDQLHRGKDGFGIAFLNKQKEIKVERATELTKVLFDLHLNQAPMIMLHHRYPTSSENKLSQTHPILVDNGSLKHKYLVVHNGVLHNEDELKKKHMDELGFVYTTDRINSKGNEEFNDSESLAIEVAMYLEKQKDEIEAIGSIAFIALQISKKTNKVNNIFFCRNTSPLNMSKTRGKLRLSSEGEGAEIKRDTLYQCNTKDFTLKKTKCELKTSKPTTSYSYNYGTGYESKYVRNGYQLELNKNESKAKYIETSSPTEEYVTDIEGLQYEIEDEAHNGITDLLEEISKTIYLEGVDDDAAEYLKIGMEELTEKIIKRLPELTKAIQDDIIKDSIYEKDVCGFIPDKTSDTKKLTTTK